MSVGVRDCVGGLVGREPLFVASSEPLCEVIRTLWRESIGALIVGTPRHPLGLISERDVIAFMAQGGDPVTATAVDVMTPHIISLRADDPVFDAAAQMLEDGIRHLPVVDGSGTVVGVVSMRDVVRPLLVGALGG